ncbi:MAG: N-acetylmuramic acid 6-phosphate etherase [Bacteroidales bacterium]|jgi:N-acetylmuramic acid 6-phosphate etherase|nr:N-acetylmuramic acid 6-phosphate etherase [Bacteroidales bacterium]MCI2121226.1 N-acetylmuramic acid 6-phosphate etherase [Bacteroidales bacterium]MCI2145984.1 N-acetylmuramic acid 6-phosphate etherase [Bacteroidales bacterium]
MKVTEQSSIYTDLEKMSVHDLLVDINREDKNVPFVVEKCIPQIEKTVNAIVERLQEGGRLFYLGAGTSGRLGVLDASEIPPTYGAPYDLIIGLIAGGDTALRKATENAEDDPEGGWNDMQPYKVDTRDVVVGIAASGVTPYVVGAVTEARKRGIFTSGITCNPDSPLAAAVDVPIVAVVGPEFVTGSTRMKSGTAEKLILNMISTSAMIRLGHVRGNKMIDMQLNNTKLIERGTRMIMDATGISDCDKARDLLLKYRSVRTAVDAYMKSEK